MSDMRARRLRLVRGPDVESSPRIDHLIGLVSRGDEQSFDALYDELSPLVYGTVRRIVRDPALSAEVTQEVFVEIWRIAPRFDPTKGSVKTWAATIAHRRAVDRVRSEQSRRDRELTDHHGDTRRAFDQVASEVETGEDHAAVHSALDSLTDPQREAVMLAYYGGHTYREVAELLDVPEGTVKTRIRDGLIRLRDKIGQDS